MKQFYIYIITFVLAICLCTNTQVTAKAKKSTSDVSLTISAAGDVTLGHDAYFNKTNRFDTVYQNIGKNKSYYFSKVKSVFAKDAMTIVNFEGTLTTSKTRADKKFAFKGPYEYIDILKKGSVEAVAFANNHCRDYGAKSYQDTISTFKKNNIKYSSYSTVGTYKVKGKTIGMISVNGLEGVAKSKSQIKSGMKKLKNADLVLVSMHCGVEGSHKANGAQKSIAHYAVDQGADLVLGHHPHVLQGVEKYKGVYIAYSLANFCFGGNRNPKNKDTMIFQKTFHFKGGKLVKDDDVKVIPCRVSSVTSRNDYQPIVLKGKAKSKVMAKINSYSKAFKLKFNSQGKPA